MALLPLRSWGWEDSTAEEQAASFRPFPSRPSADHTCYGLHRCPDPLTLRVAKVLRKKNRVILCINYTSIWKKNRVGEWRGNHRRCCTPQSPQGLGGLLRPSGLGVLITAFQNDGNERHYHSGSFKTNWVCFVLYLIFFSFLCWYNFPFTNIAQVPFIQIYQLLIFCPICFISLILSLSLCPLPYTNVWICVERGREREREREMGRKKTFPFTLSQCGFPRNMVSLFCDHITMIIIREYNVDIRLSSNLQSSFCIFKASLEKAGMGQRW